MIGASTAAYAASLAVVTAFQSTGDRMLMERQAPAENAVTRLQNGHDRLEAAIGLAADAYTEAAGRYDALGLRLIDEQTALSRLADRVGTIGGVARALPGHVSLPPISRTVIGTTSKPKTSATTGASGR